jgi:hypothetical protein
MNKKWVIAGLITLILIVGGGIWYYEAYMKNVLPSTAQAPATAASSTISYVNNNYGFTFSLPASWRGYTIATSTWTGYSTPLEHGPIISIRNPLWTSSTPTQDIPIMVFTPTEWSVVSTGNMTVSAAPFPPSELGENNQYVFALPARYNYAFPQGWQEVQSIIQGNPLRAF